MPRHTPEERKKRKKEQAAVDRTDPSRPEAQGEQRTAIGQSTIRGEKRDPTTGGARTEPLGQPKRFFVGDIGGGREVDEEEFGRATQTSQLSRIQREEFRQEDVDVLKGQVATEQETLAPSEIQKFQELRKADFTARDEKEISVIQLKNKISREEAENIFALIPIEDRIRLTTGRRVSAGVDNLLGDIGKDFLGISLNDITDTLRNKEDISAITGTLSEMASKLPAIEGMTTNGGITPQRALAK